MSRYKWTSERRKRERYWYNMNEYQGLQKEVRHLKDLLNNERDNAQNEREWRIQACNDLLETQQQLEKEKSLNEQLINRKRRPRTPLYKQRMMHRDSKTTNPMEVVTELQADKERYTQGWKRQTSSQALIPTVKQRHLKSDLRNKIRAPTEEEQKQQKVLSFRVEQDAHCQDSSFAAKQGVDKLSFKTDTEEDWAPRRKAAKPQRSAVNTETNHRQQILFNYDEVEESFRDTRNTWKNDRMYRTEETRY
ncbi:uncharacterized protein LOC117763005 [Hippoglossus hippoglossus]|uniref:uncharacterized protein LOC117763005 n=1 Tax=Hippoglossus hippoglossus TaxID=8267 RepID=UPI00148D8E5D|nr:uncharacterized protein LOC117763005 [Hippoglossus hippoglossus]